MEIRGGGLTLRQIFYRSTRMILIRFYSQSSRYDFTSNDIGWLPTRIMENSLYSNPWQFLVTWTSVASAYVVSHITFARPIYDGLVLRPWYATRTTVVDIICFIFTTYSQHGVPRKMNTNRKYSLISQTLSRTCCIFLNPYLLGNPFLPITPFRFRVIHLTRQIVFFFSISMNNYLDSKFSIKNPYFPTEGIWFFPGWSSSFSSPANLWRSKNQLQYEPNLGKQKARPWSRTGSYHS